MTLDPSGRYARFFGASTNLLRAHSKTMSSEMVDGMPFLRRALTYANLDVHAKHATTSVHL
jgi:hypothetical protein